MKILIYILLTINALGLNLEFYLRVPIPDDISFIPGRALAPTPTIISRNDGAFIIENFTDKSFGIAVKPNKKFFYYYPKQVLSTNSYKELSKTVNGNQQVILGENTQTLITKTLNSELILKSMSNEGVLFEITTNTLVNYSRSLLTHQIQPPELISTQTILNSHSEESALVFEKYDGNQIIVETKSFPKILSSKSDINHIQSSHSFRIYVEFKPGYIDFYRLTDSDLLSSPNRITLGSSQNGSLTATVNNPEQALLNIQSSTNLIDWNTFKTIKNEPSLEIVVPANKPKEFIRAIE